MSVKLTEEQREAIEWAAGQAYSYAKPMTGESLMMKRWRALSELLAVQTTMAEPCDKCGLLDANKCAECNPGPTDHPDHSGDGSKKLDMSLEARLADAEADVARLHKDKMDLWMQLHGYAPVPQEGDERRDNFDVLIKQFATEYALDRTAAGGWIFENHNLFKFVYAALASKAAPALQDVPDTLLVDLFYAAQGDITKFRVKAREILGGTKVDPVRQDGDGRAAPDIAEFSELIDSYQCAQKDGNHDERAAARIALMSAYRAALASKAAAVAVEEPTVDLSKLQWLDTSIADPVEKARRVLKHLIEPDAVYFFEDGFPRCNTIASQAACVLAVLNATVTHPAPIASAEEAAPVPMLLFCPHCGTQHVDAPEAFTPTGRCECSGPDECEACEQNRAAYEETWQNPPHRSHKCHACGCIWRPADVATTGVETIATVGKKDNWDGPGAVAAHPAAAQPSRAEVLEEAALCVDALTAYGELPFTPAFVANRIRGLKDKS
jgi:hypothetical protein